MAGPGTHLKQLIEQWVGTTADTTCSCRAWTKKMDKWGSAGCVKHLPQIVQHLMKEAKRRAADWRAVPIENGGLKNTVKNAAWRGAFLIPGIGIALRPFVKTMVHEAIRRAERDGQ